jgi:hypothetical protein
MRIGKLQDNQLISSYEIVGGLINTTLFIVDRWVSNPTVEQMEEIGYKQLNESAKQICPDGYYLQEIYTENDTEILVSYTIIENPTFGGGMPV